MGRFKIFTDLNSNLLLFHFVCVCLCMRESGAIDHIIPAFPVPLNLITSPNQPIITVSEICSCVRVCVCNFRVRGSCEHMGQYF